MSEIDVTEFPEPDPPPAPAPDANGRTEPPDAMAELRSEIKAEILAELRADQQPADDAFELAMLAKSKPELKLRLADLDQRLGRYRGHPDMDKWLAESLRLRDHLINRRAHE
jgi:hypothetical protein